MRKNSNVIFLGGAFFGRSSEFVLMHSKGVIQNAANVLQLQLMKGLLSYGHVKLHQISIPFVGSYPKRFGKAFFPSFCVEEGAIGYCVSPGFCNITGIKIFSRFFAAFKCLFDMRATLSNSCLLVYSAHMPFVLAAILIRFVVPSVKLTIVIPDLPEYMGGVGVAYDFLKKIDSFLFRFLLRYFDRYVVLTLPMAVNLNLDLRKVAVIEGIVEVDVDLESRTGCSEDIGSDFILYTGTLDPRYGIKHLLDAFELIEDSIRLKLVICGAGSGSDLVESYAVRNTRISYLGQISRDLVLELQSKALILINPRLPHDQFTKFSFPSKIMEYFRSGRPVIMYKLGGVPDEYDGYYFVPTNTSVYALKECIVDVFVKPRSDLEMFGERARRFVVSNKSPSVQVGKILNLIGIGV